MRISEVVPIEDHILFVETEEGTTGVFDLRPYLRGKFSKEVFERKRPGSGLSFCILVQIQRIRLT